MSITTRTKIKEIETGTSAEIYLMVKSVAQKETRAKRPYVVAELTDGETEIHAKLWNKSKSEFRAAPGNVIRTKLTVSNYNDSPDYVMEGDDIADATVDKREFLHTAPIPPEQMYAEIMKVIDQMPNRDAAAIVTAIFTEKKEQILHWTAARKVHHTGIGELLYHSYRMMRAGIADCKIYRKADASMVVAGCVLHDIGKFEELDVDPTGNTTLTVDGALFGHIYLGCRMIEEYGRKVCASEETIRQLCHIVASHHGKKEWGAIAVPSTLEAYIVHQCDMRDAKMYLFEHAYDEQADGTVSTDPNYFLEQAYIYKPAR